MLKRIAVLVCMFAIAGCSEPEPQVIELDKAAADAGLAPEDYTVHENGAIQIHAIAPALESHERFVSRDNFAGSWPFITDSGIIGCKDSAVYFISGNDTYGINGFSHAYSKSRDLEWLPLTTEGEFWLPNPEIAGTKISVADMISAGLELCDDR